MNAVLEPLKARRLYLLLREQITGGHLGDGARLPGEPQLATEHGVSRVTVRRALDLLVQEGLLHRRVGSGTFVRRPVTSRPVVANMADLLSGLIMMGRDTEVRLLSCEYVQPGPGIAEALRLAPGERVQRSVRVRLMDGVPFSHLTTHVPEWLGRTYAEGELGTTPFLQLMARAGVRAEQAEQEISATIAGPTVAEALGLDIGAPLLALTRIVQDAEGRGVEHLQALYRPDRYAFRMQLVRSGQNGVQHWAPVAAAPRGRPST